MLTRSFWKDDSGVAMVTVVGVMALMTVVAVAAFSLASQATKDSVRVSSGAQAFQCANSGVDVALARMQGHGYVASDYSPPLHGTTSDGGSYDASVTPSSNSEYKCISVGHDSAGATSTVIVKFFYLNIWSMNLAGGSDQAMGGGTLHGNAGVTGPFYVRGGASLGGNSYIHGGPLFVKNGSLSLASGSAEVGTTANPIDVYVSLSYPVGASGFHARSVSSNVPDVTLPVIDLASEFAAAQSQSVDNKQGDLATSTVNLECTLNAVTHQPDATTYTTMNPPNHPTAPIWARSKAAGASTYYKVVGADSGFTGTHPLTIGATSFGTWFGDTHTTTAGQHDDFAFDSSTGRLYVEGTVFVDGPLTFSRDIIYVGNGAIVANGDVNFSGQFLPDTTGNVADAQHCVGIVTPQNINFTRGNYAGAFFAAKWASMTSTNINVTGSVIAGGIDFSKPNDVLATNPNLPQYLPKAMPGNGDCILTKGAWIRQ